MSAVLTFTDVHKRFGTLEVLRGVTLAVGAGEAVGLVGVNGAGKTTLIRGLLDLTRIDRGRIDIAGRAHLATAARSQLSYLPERFNPPFFATGFELLEHLCALHGVRFERERAEAEAEALDLSPEHLARPAREYSKGMAQKLGVIACILPARPLLVLDEPMSGLDPRARACVKARLAALRDGGTALFFSTHLLVDVQALCDRVAILDRGRIVFDDRPRALAETTGRDDLEEAFLAALDAESDA